MPLITVKDGLLFVDTVEEMFKKACDTSAAGAVNELVSDQELEHLRAAFYAGAAAIFMLEEELADLNIPDEAAFMALDNVQGDCEDFFMLQSMQLPEGRTLQ